jgi:gliding motility-associated-like protein
VSGYDSNIDQFAWDFQNDGTDDIPLGEAGENTAVEFTYPSAGPFTVKVTRFNHCQAMMPPDPFYPSQTLAIVINPGPDPAESMLNDPNNNLLCPDQVLTGSFTLGNNATYEWSTGETTPTKLITNPGVYSVTVTEIATGCSVTKLQGMDDYFNGFELGENLDFCEGATHTITSGLTDPSLMYTWTLRPVNPAGGDVPLTNGAAPFQQPLNTTVPGTFTYILSVSEPGVCTTTDEVTFTINASPDFTLNVNPAACGGQGSIDLTVNAPASLFRYTVAGPSIVPSISDIPPGALQNIGPLDGGVYNVTVLDQLSQCAITQQRSIFDNTVTVTIDNISNCSPFTINASTNVVGTYTFDVVDPSLQVIATGTASAPTFQVSSPLLQINSSYSVVVTNALQCKGSAPTGPLVQGPAYGLGITFNCATNSVQAVVLSGAPPTPTNYTFTAPAGLIVSQDAVNGTAVLSTTMRGLHNVKVRAEGAGPTCPGEFEMPILIDPFTATITQDPANGCADQVSVAAVATPAGNYSYNWTRNGTPFAAPANFNATTADHNSIYGVTVRNTGGCQQTASRAITVFGQISVSLAVPTLACEGNDLELTALPQGTPDNFVWSFDGSTIAGANTATIITPARRGTYTVTAVRGPCQASDDIVVTPFVPTPIDLGPLKRICNLPGAPPNQGTAIIRANPATFATYTWINPDQTEVVTNVGEYTATMVGTHTVNAINPNGCLSIDQVEVVLDCDPVIAGPNAFRPTSTVVGGPNNDNVNQNFFLYTFFIDPSSFEIMVFNRWGEMVFRSTDPGFRWNGGYNNNINNPLPGGTYSYLVRYKSENSPGKGVQEERGGVLLLR